MKKLTKNDFKKMIRKEMESLGFDYWEAMRSIINDYELYHHEIMMATADLIASDSSK